MQALCEARGDEKPGEICNTTSSVKSCFCHEAVNRAPQGGARTLALPRRPVRPLPETSAPQPPGFCWIGIAEAAFKVQPQRLLGPVFGPAFIFARMAPLASPAGIVHLSPRRISAGDLHF